MIENSLNGKNYYDGYRGDDLGIMFERLRKMDMPRGELADFGQKEKISMLVLGSATRDNLSHISRIDSFLRPGKVEQDRAVIIDLNMFPLADHKKKVDWLEGKDNWTGQSKSTPEFPFPKFELAQADMRQLPFKESSFDLIISDYTLNFLNNFTDVDKAFGEMARVLCPYGVALISLRGNVKYPNRKNIPAGMGKEMQVKTMGEIKVNFFPLKTYLECAEKHGLEAAASDTWGTDMCVVLKKSSGALFI